MVIFVEGFEETGKSHIANALAKKYNLQYWKNEDNEEFEDGNFHELLKYHYAKLPKMCKMFEKLGSGVVFDRNFITEAVYAEVFNRKTYPNILKYLEHTYADMGAITIHCYKEKFKSFKDPHILFSDYKTIEETYMKYYDDFSYMPVCLLNTTDENLEEQLKIIDNFIKGVSECQYV